MRFIACRLDASLQGTRMSYEKETNSDASCRFGIGKCQNESFNLGHGKLRFYNSSLKKLVVL